MVILNTEPIKLVVTWGLGQNRGPIQLQGVDLLLCDIPFLKKLGGFLHQAVNIGRGVVGENLNGIHQFRHHK